MKFKYIRPADILLPKENFSKWSVIACDQYTSEPLYWEKVKQEVGNHPSAYNIILPEAFLGEDDAERINKINSAMTEYLNGNVFDCIENSAVYIERTLKNGKVRKGFLTLIDLEEYSYEAGSNALIRATEKTVVERIPARVNIRKDATVEIPHIMLLIDDSRDSAFRYLDEKKSSLTPIYDFTLMQNAGSIKGYRVDENTLSQVDLLLDALKTKSESGMLFAVGDGNHSLAAAKECYRMGKGPRYALAEIVNIHDTSLAFEPIYRIVLGEEPQKLITAFADYCREKGSDNRPQTFTCVYGDNKKEITVNGTGSLAVATLQEFLDCYRQQVNIEIDYIHGINSVTELSRKENSVGFIFEGMEKSDLFPAVEKDGSLPRKTFSMGCADDKRFYLEARSI